MGKEGEGTSQRICLNDPRTWITVWGLTVGAGRGLGGGGPCGKNWNQCNRITIIITLKRTVNSYKLVEDGWWRKILPAFSLICKHMIVTDAVRHFLSVSASSHFINPCPCPIITNFTHLPGKMDFLLLTHQLL